MRALRLAVLGLALFVVVAASGACRRSEPAATIAVEPRPAPGLTAWRLEPEDLLAQPVVPPLQPWTLAIVSGEGIDTQSLREGFSVPETQEGEPFVWATGDRSRVRFALEEAVACTLDLRLRPFAPPDAAPQSVEIALNDASLGRFGVPLGGAVQRIPLPVALLRPGWNEIELRPAWSARPQDVLPGSDDPRSLSVAIERLRLLRTGPALETVTVATDGAAPIPALSFDGDGVARWLLRIPRDRTLELGWIAPRTEGRQVTLTVDADTDAGRVAIWSQELPADGRSGSAAVDLAALGSDSVRLRLGVAGLPAGQRWLWTRASLLGREPAPVAAASAPSRPRTSVALVVLDAAQRARFGAYGSERGASPHFDALAREGLLFADAVSSAPYTLASTASLFTGLPPPRHGVVEKTHRLDAKAPTLAEVLRGAGYATAAFSANIFVTRRYGMDRGFETFEELFHRPGLFPIVPADAFDEPVYAWLRAAADGARSGERPFFLYLHYIQPHEPYDVGPRDLYTGLDPAYEGPIDGSVESMYRVFDGSLELDDADRAQLQRLYEGNLRYADAALGRLVAELRSLALLDDMLLIVTSDHGEALGERGLYGHNTSLDETMTAIPLVARLPSGLVPQPQRITVPVSTVDLAPMIVETVGLASPPSFEGRNPLRDLAGEDAARVRYARTAGSRPHVGIWLDDAKCVLPADGRPERFGAQAAVDAGAPETAEDTLVSIELCRMAKRVVEAGRPEAPAAAAGALSEQERAVLEALGYLRE